MPESPATTEPTRISVDRIGSLGVLPDGRTFILSYVTEAGLDMTGIFTATRRQLTQADTSVLASVDAATEGCRWEVGLRDPPALRRPPFLTKYQALTKEVIMAMMQQRHQKWQQNFHKLQDARKMKFEAVHQHHGDVSIIYMVIKTERPSYQVQFPRPPGLFPVNNSNVHMYSACT